MRKVNRVSKVPQFFKVTPSSNQREIVVTSLLHPIRTLRFVCGGKERLAVMEADDVVAFTVDHEHRTTNSAYLCQIGELVEG